MPNLTTIKLSDVSSIYVEQHKIKIMQKISLVSLKEQLTAKFKMETGG